MAFGDYIKSKREHKGLSLREAAKRSGISHPYLSQLENGKTKNPNPSKDVVRKLSNGLNISYVELMNEAGYITTETDSLIEAFGATPNEIKKIKEGEIIGKGKKYTLKKIHLDHVLKNKDMVVYYDDEVITEDDKKSINQLISIHLKRR